MSSPEAAAVDRGSGRWVQSTVGAARSPAGLAAALSTLLSLIWVFLPPTGSDLAAQVAHAEFFGRVGWLPVDMRWFGGTDVFSYSVISPPLMALLGVSAFAVLTTVLASALFGLLLARCDVHRPRVAALVGTGCFAGNLMVGRLTFALGIAVGLATLLAIWVPGRARVVLLVFGAVMTWAASPLAALFLAMVGVGLVLRRHVAVGVALASTVGVLLAASAVLGQRGVMPMGADDLVKGLVVCAVVALVTRYPVVRIVAVLCAFSLVFAYCVATPVGVNAVRFPAIFAVPVVLATSRLRWRTLVPVVAVAALLIPPMNLSDAVLGRPAAEQHFFVALNRELVSLPITGRVEVVPTANRWEAVYVARRVPLARGWMTQVDKANNDLFFDSSKMTAGRYAGWLHRNAVQYVAVSDADPASSGAAEKMLVDTGLPYLSPVWNNADWTVYAVRHPTTVVSGATLVAQDDQGITFHATRPADVLVRVRWSSWLTLDGPGGCLHPEGSWTAVHVIRAGTYHLSSEIIPDSAAPVCAPS